MIVNHTTEEMDDLRQDIRLATALVNALIFLKKKEVEDAREECCKRAFQAGWFSPTHWVIEGQWEIPGIVGEFRKIQESVEQGTINNECFWQLMDLIKRLNTIDPLGKNKKSEDNGVPEYEPEPGELQTENLGQWGAMLHYH